MRIVAGIIGFLIIWITLQDAFETVVLPRRVSRKFRLARMYYVFSWRAWGAIARKIESNDRREYFLSFYGPLSLIVLLGLWAIGLILGFGLVQLAFGSALAAPERVPDFGTDLYMSGTTFFTLGLGDVTPRTVPARVVTVIESGMGFAFLALMIGYLPVLYQSFSRREVGISMLDAHAGSPPNAVELLRRHRQGQVMSELVEHLHTWENWAAELLESHLSYPVLAYYRSQHDRQSWLAALTAILDTCALLIVGIDDVPQQSAWFTFAMANHAAVDLAQVFAEPFNTQLSRLPPSDFGRLKEALASAGIFLHDEETAEERLAALRQKYEPYVMSLARRLQMPLPGWFPEEQEVDDWQTSAWNHATQTPARP